jgi:hypothetical protein
VLLPNRDTTGWCASPILLLLLLPLQLLPALLV